MAFRILCFAKCVCYMPGETHIVSNDMLDYQESTNACRLQFKCCEYILMHLFNDGSVLNKIRAINNCHIRFN